MPRTDSTSITFTDSNDLKYGSIVSPRISHLYPRASSSQRHEKVMIQITGGYSATKAAPLSFSGSTRLWYNPMINLYIHHQSTYPLGFSFYSTMSSMNNPHPYQK